MLERIEDKIIFQSQFTKALGTYGFMMPSYEIYGGSAGFFDLGPNGCALKQHIIERWRSHFVLEDSMMEIECSSIVPEAALKASGHVDRFTDLMVSDTVTGKCYRADHLLKQIFDDNTYKIESTKVNLDETDPDKMNHLLNRYDIKAPETGNVLSFPYNYNLMFSTSIGATNSQKGYLRPETAPGIFTNFKNLFQQNGNRLPLSVAQIGQSYRNEITPRNGLLRVREFTQAEIEYFYDPEAKHHPSFQSVAQQHLLLMANDRTECHETSLFDALGSGIISNEIMAYFIGRTWVFLNNIGIDSSRIRFRQHSLNEMAHYALDCWDAEIQINSGWIECVGIADRSDFDLRCHSQQSRRDLTASASLEEAIIDEVWKPHTNHTLLGKQYRIDGKKLEKYFESQTSAQLSYLKQELDANKSITISLDGRDILINSQSLKLTKEKSICRNRTFFANTIEPSFGIGRIMHCLLEHAFYRRSEDHDRIVFSLKALVSPTEISILPLLHREEYNAVACGIKRNLTSRGIKTKIDLSGTSIGRKYARADANGTPFNITVDADAIPHDGSVTVRDRDSKEQVRINRDELCDVIYDICKGVKTWEIIKVSHPMITN